MLAKAAENDAWTEIAREENGMGITTKPTIHTRVNFNLAVEGQTWQYFCFEVSEVADPVHGSALEIADFEFEI